MSRFIDEYLPDCVPGYPCVSSPRWATDITQVDSGAEKANQRWSNPLHRFQIPTAVRDMDIFNAVRDHWLVMRGPFYTWPWRDPLDFASVALSAPNTVPTITNLDQPLGTGDGFTTTFQLVKRYTIGAQTLDRVIELPRTASVIVKATLAGDPSYVAPTFSVSRPGGVVTFDAPPADNAVLTAGYLFDVPVRFESDDSFDGIVQTFGLGGFADLTFIETRNC